MTIHLQRQIDKLKQAIKELGLLVQSSVQDAIVAVESGNRDLAKSVIERDEEIDRKEVDVEEECLHTLALHQPVAFDLRYVIAVLKINNDLERIGDLAVNVAEQTLSLTRENQIDTVPYDLSGMAERVNQMLTTALASLINVDADLADSVRAEDDEVDRLHAGMYDKVEAAIAANPGQMGGLIRLMNISRHLERTADLACNIAEDVIYMARGDILRHGFSDRPQD